MILRVSQHLWPSVCHLWKSVMKFGLNTDGRRYPQMSTDNLPILVAHVALLGIIPAFAADFAADIKPFLEANCTKCHGPEKQKGRLRLDTLTDDFSDSHTASMWIEVRDNLNLGEMPPEDEPRPDGDQVIAVSQWIATELRAIQAQANSTGGNVLLRRLSRTEYANTVRDLLKINFEQGEGPEKILPPDGTLEGFNKVSKALLLDPSLMESYFEAAKFVADRAVAVRPPRVATYKDRYEFETIPKTGGISYIATRRSNEMTDDGIILYADLARTGAWPRHPYNDRTFPILGKYKIRVKAGAHQGENDQPVFMEIRFINYKKRIRVDAPIENPEVYEWHTTINPNRAGELQVAMVPSLQFTTTNIDSTAMRSVVEGAAKEERYRDSLRVWQQGAAEGFYTTFQQTEPVALSQDLTKLPKLFLDYIEVEGPLQEEFPPASTQNLYPKGYANPQSQTLESAREVFGRLLPRAFRRPVADSEIEEQVRIVANELEQGESFHNVMKIGLVAMLCAPDFLYLLEPEPGDRGRKLNDHELATRLSYFLWSSMPDDELFGLAKAGRLSDSAVLDAQVTRMLADSRAEALVTDFADQWLKISEFDQFRPDEGIYHATYYGAQFAGIARDMEEEARAFFREILRKDESVLNFLDSDWIMANEKLASYYGISGIEGEEFRRVALPADSPRGGIVGMAGFHKWGADGNRTKPVERGKYLLGVLFNDPPDPPPPNAGEVEPNVQGERLTVRERLLRHQEVEACAGCHRTIDPYGLALENFNVVGLWRDVQDGEQRHFWTYNPPPIITEGTLPNGQAYASFAEFKALLAAQSERFERGLAEKLMVYALGRMLEPTDDGTIQDLVAEMGNRGHTMSSLIRGIVKTEAFRSK